jgi:hypothetical protein
MAALRTPGYAIHGKPVQRVNVPLAHFLFPPHPGDFVELGSHPNLEKTIMHKKRDLKASFFMHKWRPQGDSNPCYRRERAVS